MTRRAGHETYLTVNPIACHGHGICAEMLPEHITLDPWGYPILHATPIDAEDLRDVRRAIALCPRLALQLQQQPARPAPRSRSTV